MAEDLLDHWVNLMKPIFPSYAWIVSEDSKNNHVVQIDWRLDSGCKQQNKRSRKIQIIIKEEVIDDYLARNKEDRDFFNAILKESLCERYDRFVSDSDGDNVPSAPIETWLFSKNILTALIDKHSHANI